MGYYCKIEAEKPVSLPSLRYRNCFLLCIISREKHDTQSSTFDYQGSGVFFIKWKRTVTSAL